ncbi:MAG: branched-chain amino acid ABC transporter permease [Desulforhabdus sp.]|jgi:branched-chain amino acid transport system permease protein|nr:branched-chain amino acid ABC transporter permease [Desulforhabdus sp.]
MKKTDRWIFLVLICLIAVFPWLAQNIGAISHYVELMIFAGMFSLVCLGLSLLMGYAGQISMAQAAFFGIGAYSSGILTAHFGWNPWLAMPVGASTAAAVAWLVGIPALRLKGHYLAMATLGFGVIVHIIFNEEVDWTGGPSGMVDIPGLSIAGWKITSEMQWYYLVWGVVLVVLLFSFHLLHSRVGRALRAIHEEEVAAEAMGVPTFRYKVQIFIFGAVTAAIAGSLYTHYVTFLSPSSFNLMWSIRFVLMVMAGGMQSLWGALLGTVLLTFVGNEWLQVFADFEVVVYGAILLVVALFLPQGLISLFHRAPGARHNPVSPASDEG